MRKGLWAGVAAAGLLAVGVGFAPTADASTFVQGGWSTYADPVPATTVGTTASIVAKVMSTTVSRFADVEVKVLAPSGAQVFTQRLAHRTFTVNVRRGFTFAWPVPATSPPGSYRVTVGVFGDNGGPQQHLNTNATTFTVKAPATTTTTTTRPTTTTTVAATTTTAPGPASNITFPARGAFYYPWFPETWTVNGAHVAYHPTDGYYNSDDAAVTAHHVAEMDYANIDVAITSWWGPGTHNELARVTTLLDKAAAGHVKVAFYYEKEGNANVPQATITADLEYLQAHYGNHPGAAKVNGKLVVFVYNVQGNTCAEVDKWKAANTIGAYINLKVFSNFKACPQQPEGWHQYGPATAEQNQPGYAFAISPGFKRADEPTARLERDPVRWSANVAHMNASTAPWHLVTTFSEWGEGTAIEPATEWGSASGFGTYLDELHAPSPPPTTTTTVRATTTTAAPTSTTAPPAGSFTLLAAGDICTPSNRTGSTQTADLIKTIPALPVLALGDTQYNEGTLAQYQACYDLSWGAFRDRTFPAPGNHEYLTPGAAGYYDYFGVRAGPDRRGYYEIPLGANWVGVSLNSELTSTTGMPEQVAWLNALLDANPGKQILAELHKPLFSSGEHGNNPSTRPLWTALYAHHADIILVGHDHDYERMAPVNPANVAVVDPNGIREFVVGTGGASERVLPGALVPVSESFNDNTWGVLQLTLTPSSYSWKFLPVAGKTFTDSGTYTITN